MQAVILAGGKGTRLRPYTTVFPKPLVPVADVPILEIIIRQLKKHSFDEIVISTGHLAELIEAYFGDGSRWGVHIDYVREYKPLNTAGALGLIDDLKDNFLVMNGDILTTLDYSHLFDFHTKKKGIATISLHKREAKIDYGVIEMTNDLKLDKYIEKPAYQFLVSMGVNVLSARCREYIGKNEAIGLPDLMMKMKEEGEDIYCFSSDCYWLDIGRVEDYQIAQDEFEHHREQFLPDEK